MVTKLIGRKIDQIQGFLADGTRVPLSLIRVKTNVVTQVKTTEKDGYNALQVGFGSRKKLNQALTGHLKKAGVDEKPQVLSEIRLTEPLDIKPGALITAADILKPGDLVNVKGLSKGKGYAGVVKRHHFKGGPRTHGQSDRERAPGSIGQTTTPGRVYKGKRMAGKMGAERVTVKNLQVINLLDDMIYLKGLVPGVKNAIVTIEKIGKSKKFTPLPVAEKATDEEKPEVK